MKTVQVGLYPNIYNGDQRGAQQLLVSEPLRKNFQSHSPKHGLRPRLHEENFMISMLQLVFWYISHLFLFPNISHGIPTYGGFHKMGVPLVIIHLKSDFPLYTIHFWGAPIYGNLHLNPRLKSPVTRGPMARALRRANCRRGKMGKQSPPRPMSSG